MLKAIGIFLIIFEASKAQEGQSRYPEYDEQMCQGLDESAIIGIPNECYYYYYCYEGVAYLDDCENICEGCQFDVAINDCNYQEYVQCVQPEEPAPPGENPQTPAPVVTTPGPQSPTDDITCPPNEIIFLASENCSEYYVCAMGKKLTLQCLEGLVWNDDDQKCDHPIYSARCSGLDKDNNNQIRCNRQGFYSTAYPFDCGKFVFCSEGIPMVRKINFF